MPHLVILYTRNLDAETDMKGLCRSLCDTLLDVRDEQGGQPFPTGGTRVLAFASDHHAIADGRHDYAFVYLNLRMARGRSEAVKKATGEALSAAARAHFGKLLDQRYIGITLQIDEGQEVYDVKHSSIHPLFRKG